MTIRRSSWARSFRHGGGFGVLLVLYLAGCEPNHSNLDPAEKATPTASQDASSTTASQVPVDPRLQQSFAEATRSEPPADGQRPPDLTLTGKSVGKLYTEVVRLWDTIRFATKTGTPITYTAVLDTELGVIEIALQPNLAPNHVRNFVALARAGYYDGLVFERTIHAKSEAQPEIEVEVLEGGCPLGTGDLGVGSLGYWLKPEFSKETHDIGTVGACRGQEPDTAACRFYITLSKAPFLDGNFTVFGKVTQGLEVARRIFCLPVRNDPEYPEGDRPAKPVVIRKVIIRTSDDPPAGNPQ
ncbi:MAG TPA: peptidylprolyl isomerase [Gemmataceae bacterium]|nr:peptidylprolyl isomerase [Gemmataceae bacterium]